jgi:hypothetical protein
MSKVNMIDNAGNAFTASLKRSRDLVASGAAKVADEPKPAPAKKVVAKKAPARKVAAKKAPAKKAASKSSGYSTRAMKATR